MAMAQGFTREQVHSILEDVRSSQLVDETTRTLLLFSERVTREPSKMAPEEIEHLREMGISDAAILEAVHVISLFNYLDRMADALGTPVENFQDMMEG
jgi:alkylhydroperoxidase family enzyme